MEAAKIRVLIVEDDLRIADLHQRFVGKVEGFEVVGIAVRIDDALEMIEALQPDLVLLDLFFPKVMAWSCCVISVSVTGPVM